MRRVLILLHDQIVCIALVIFVKSSFSCLKVQTRKMRISKSRKWDTSWLASVKTKMLRKRKIPERLTREVACLIKKWNEFNAWTFSFMQNHALHNIRILHQVCVLCSSGTGMLSLAPDKSFRKTFGEKEDDSNRSKLLKDFFQPSQKFNQLAAKRKSRRRWKSWHSKVSPGKKPLCGRIFNFKTLVW